MKLRSSLAALALLSSVAAAGCVARAAEPAYDAATVARGRYLVAIGGCNDCHTAGYGEHGGNVPEKEWLIGVPVGFQGPWGTTYPANLRLVINSMSEAQWLEHARKERLPPMPWFGLRAMSDADLKAMYAFVRSLGPAGVAVPAYVAPGGKVDTPYFVFVPVTDQKRASIAH